MQQPTTTPQGGDHIEMIPNGCHTAVTTGNVHDYARHYAQVKMIHLVKRPLEVAATPCHSMPLSAAFYHFLKSMPLPSFTALHNFFATYNHFSAASSSLLPLYHSPPPLPPTFYFLPSPHPSTPPTPPTSFRICSWASLTSFLSPPSTGSLPKISGSSSSLFPSLFLFLSSFFFFVHFFFLFLYLFLYFIFFKLFIFVLFLYLFSLHHHQHHHHITTTSPQHHHHITTTSPPLHHITPHHHSTTSHHTTTTTTTTSLPHHHSTTPPHHHSTTPLLPPPPPLQHITTPPPPPLPPQTPLERSG